LDLETAYEELKKCTGTQFDEKVVDAFFELNIKPLKVEVAEINIEMALDI
jgi:HD-GYP domain-containing protein (c-di-GMP phosphodiesterase class II)